MQTMLRNRLYAVLASIVAALGAVAVMAPAPAAAATQAGPSATVCRNWHQTSPCQTFTSSVADLRGASLGDDSASSLHVASGYVTLYRDPNFTGVCEQFSADNDYLLNSTVGNDEASSLRITSTPTTGCVVVPPPLRTVGTVCRGTNFQDYCQDFDHDVADLSGTAVGNDTISSVNLHGDGAYVVLWSEPNFKGQCREFNAWLGSLVQTTIGNDTASSLMVRGNLGNCHNPSTVTITTVQRDIRYLETLDWSYYCPAERPYQVGYDNNSSPNVTSVHLEDHDTYLKIGFTNWNVTGGQVYGIRQYCSINNP